MKVFYQLTILTLLASWFTQAEAQAPAQNAFLKLRFEHVSGNSPIILRDSVYTTPLGDSVRLTKLKYYTSNFLLDGKQFVVGDDNYQLIDLSKETDFALQAPPGRYSSLSFTLGVDSARNNSGAQTGALDPMNDMFWTWNSGYVMFKLEGSSPASNADRNRIEHHVGGYRPGQNVATLLSFNARSPIVLVPGDTTMLTIKMDLDKYWNSENIISLKEDPVCTLPGSLAMKIAANFRHMFTLHTTAEGEK